MANPIGLDDITASSEVVYVDARLLGTSTVVESVVPRIALAKPSRTRAPTPTVAAFTGVVCLDHQAMGPLLAAGAAAGAAGGGAAGGASGGSMASVGG